MSILQCYYDVDYAHRFDELFGVLKIAANPTDERGKYLALCLNFSGVELHRLLVVFHFSHEWLHYDICVRLEI